jgi:hypothetical protein
MVRGSHLHLKILKILAQILKVVTLDVQFVVLVGIRTSMSILLLGTLNSPWTTSRTSIPTPVLTPGNMGSLGTKEATVSILGFTYGRVCFIVSGTFRSIPTTKDTAIEMASESAAFFSVVDYLSCITVAK